MGTTPLILNIAHDAAARSIRSTMLRGAGFDVIEAEGVLDAIRLSTELAPRLVLVDSSLPNGDAFEICRRLRTEAGSSMPAVLAVGLKGNEGVPLALETRARLEADDWSEIRCREFQRMEVIGHLAGGIAHDFNNILTAMLGFSEMLAELHPVAAASEPAVEIRKATERAAGLTRRLLKFSRRQPRGSEVVDAGVVLRDVERLLRRIIGEHIELTMRLGSSGLSFRGDPTDLEQIILNLVVNARDALPRGGKIVVDANLQDLDAAFATKHRPLRPGRYVALVVSDNGAGIPEAIQDRIFEPFFTTKAEGDGTGLGLAIVYSTVKQLSGYIWVDTELGKGTSFRIYLPAVHQKSESLPATPPAPVLADRGSAAILVAEDDDSVRTYVASILRRHGYEVLTAEDGAGALKLAESAERLDLLLTDVVMPRMSGRELVDRLCERHRDLPTVFMSGYPEEIIVKHGIVDPGARLLRKPFKAAELLQEVCDALKLVVS